MESAVETLFLALEREESLGAVGDVAFLRAQAHEGLRRFAGRLTCEQTWKPSADALAAAGIASVPVVQTGSADYDLVLLLPERQREQTFFDLARGLRLLKPGGTLMVALPNTWGAVRYEKHMAELAGSVETISKHHCRAFWARKTADLDTRLLREWLKHGEPRPIEGEADFFTVPGVFSWESVDPGSRLLAGHLPAGLAGRVADLGAGSGFLARSILEHRPHVTALHLYEADAVALDLARRNLAGVAGGGASVAFEWHDVTGGLGFAQFDAVVMNPPFHAGREADPRLGLSFIASGLGALRPGGQLWVVANQFLPYERFLASALPNSRVVVQDRGFKVLSGSRSKADETGRAPDPVRRRPRPRRLQRRGLR